MLRKKNDQGRNGEDDSKVDEQHVEARQDAKKLHRLSSKRKNTRYCEKCGSELESTRKSDLCEACGKEQLQNRLKIVGAVAAAAIPVVRKAVPKIAKKARPVVVNTIKKMAFR